MPTPKGQVPSANQVVLAARKYTLADVVQAWRSRDWAMMADAARLYPSLVTAIQVDPVLAMLSLWGHKRALMCEKKLRVLVYAARREAISKVPGGRQVVEKTQTPRPIVVPPKPGEDEGLEIDKIAGEILADLEDD